MKSLTIEQLRNGVLKHIEPINGKNEKVQMSTDNESIDDDLTTKERLMNIVEDIDYFKDAEGIGWAKIDGVCHPVRSTLFKRHLQHQYYDRYGKPPYDQALKDVLDQAESIALFDTGIEKVHVRVANSNGNIIIDRFNGMIKVTQGGWKNVSSTDVNFWRPEGLKALPEPTQGPVGISTLREYLNFETNSDFKLLVAWLLAAYNPDIACPILVLQGEQGSAKTTNAKVMRSLIDPSIAMVSPTPNKERNLIIQAHHFRVLCFDNLSGINKWFSDALCRICTGTGFMTRKLHTNDDQIIFQVKRPIILNGIDDIATRGDLLDRSIVLNLPSIPPHKRRDERAFWKAFKEDQPSILAALYDALATGLAESKPNLTELPRMADFAEWITRCEAAFDWEGESMLQAYNKNKDNAIKIVLDEDYLASGIMKIMESQTHYEGTATELINELQAVTPEVDQKYLPTTNTLKDRLRRLAPSLRKVGITWEYDRKGSDGTRTYVLDKVENKVSELSVMSEDDQNSDTTDSSDSSKHVTSELPL